MTSIRKFAFAALLAAITGTFAPIRVSAQEAANGKFTLTHSVRWGNAVIPAGSYRFTFKPEGVSPVLYLSTASGSPASYMVLVQGTDELASPAINRLVVKTTKFISYVTEMELPDFGMTLHFSEPHTTEKTVAKGGLVASVGGQ